MKKWNKEFVWLFLLLCGSCLLYRSALAFNEEITHPRLTERSVYESNLNRYLISNLGIPEGIDKIVTNTSNNQSGMNTSTAKSIKYWFMSGSTDEDIPMCRASNHFHNPLLAWKQSYMSDDSSGNTAAIRKYCNADGWPYGQRKSNVVWATGLLEDGTMAKITNNSETDPPSPNTWNKARHYYNDSLTKSQSVVRDTYFAKTLQALGQVLHLLEDMAVPAHVRNDFQSHLMFADINSINFTKWYYNLFENYVLKQNSKIDENIGAIRPNISAYWRLTNFWDTGSYKHSYDAINDNYDPAVTINNVGLAEYTNANFVSDLTFTFGLGGETVWGQT